MQRRRHRLMARRTTRSRGSRRGMAATALIVLVGLFNGRRRLLHDIVLGTVVINSFARTQPAQPARTY